MTSSIGSSPSVTANQLPLQTQEKVPLPVDAAEYMQCNVSGVGSSTFGDGSFSDIGGGDEFRVALNSMRGDNAVVQFEAFIDAMTKHYTDENKAAIDEAAIGLHKASGAVLKDVAIAFGFDTKLKPGEIPTVDQAKLLLPVLEVSRNRGIVSNQAMTHLERFSALEAIKGDGPRKKCYREATKDLPADLKQIYRSYRKNMAGLIDRLRSLEEIVSGVADSHDAYVVRLDMLSKIFDFGDLKEMMESGLSRALEHLPKWIKVAEVKTTEDITALKNLARFVDGGVADGATDVVQVEAIRDIYAINGDDLIRAMAMAEIVAKFNDELTKESEGVGVTHKNLASGNLFEADTLEKFIELIDKKESEGVLHTSLERATDAVANTTTREEGEGDAQDAAIVGAPVGEMPQPDDSSNNDDVDASFGDEARLATTQESDRAVDAQEVFKNVSRAPLEVDDLVVGLDPAALDVIEPYLDDESEGVRRRDVRDVTDDSDVGSVGGPDEPDYSINPQVVLGGVVVVAVLVAMAVNSGFFLRGEQVG